MHDFLKNAYENETVLVTGHTGFKGSWLTSWLVMLQAKVVGYSIGTVSEPNLFESLDLEKEITHITGDVRDGGRLLQVVDAHRPKFVFHLAAQSLVRYSFDEPVATYDTNVMGTVNVLETVRRTESVRSCTIVTSDKCYERTEKTRAYKETDRLGGEDPYSSSKGCAEIVTSAYRKSFCNPAHYGRDHNVAISSVRAGNVVGGGDWGKDRILPDCARSLSEGHSIELRYPHAVRPWQYVLEPLSGYLLLGALMSVAGPRYGDAWNFGPAADNVGTVEELVKLTIQHWGSGSYRIGSSEGPREAAKLTLDATKAHKYLGWRQIYELDETVRRTVDWYRSYYGGMSKADLFKMINSEIDDYANRMPGMPASADS